MDKKILSILLLILSLFLLSSCKDSIEEDLYWTVTFTNYNGDILKQEKVKSGESAKAPTMDNLLEFNFIRWSEPVDNIIKDLTVKALYGKDGVVMDLFKVVFLNKDGEILKEQIVAKEGEATPPPLPLIKGETFISWDQDISNVTSDLIVKPVYEKTQYTVKFVSDGKLVEEQEVFYGESISAPLVERSGYTFINWDHSLTNITSSITINAIWQKQMGASYSELAFPVMEEYKKMLKNIETKENLIRTITNVKENTTRGANEIVYYNNPNKFNTNIYGFEVAVNQDNLVIEKATKVVMPTNGFVISGHGTAIDLLDNAINVGDYVVYTNNEVKVYRNNEINRVIGLGIELKRLEAEVIKADQTMKALDYKEIVTTFTNAADYYNSLIFAYNENNLKLAEELTLSINFMLIEPTATSVRAIWHYPTRTSTYTERDTSEISKYLDNVKSLGINRVYLNTNFNGKSVYPSEYLIQGLTAYNTYQGYSDYLDAFIGEAHARNIEIYAWTNTLIAGDGSNNPWYSTRGWLSKGYNGEDNYGRMYYLDISNDEVLEFLGNVFYELASKYNLDGIEYDFIRFPVGNLYSYSGGSTANISDFGWTDSFITKFMNQYNLTGDLKTLVISNSTIRANWLEFKRQTLNDTVGMLHEKIQSANPNIKISAAVMPSITGAKNTYLQDWETWIKNDYVDELNPMIYTADNNYLENALTNMKKVTLDYATIVAGIFPEGSGGLPYMSAQQIAIIESLNVDGFAKFSSRQLFGTPLEKAMRNMNREYLVLPTASKNEIYEAYQTDLLDKIVNYYQYKVNEPRFDELIKLINTFDETTLIDSKMHQIENHLNLIENDLIKTRLLNEHQKNTKILIK